jgi:hypothetical protein
MRFINYAPAPFWLAASLARSGIPRANGLPKRGLCNSRESRGLLSIATRLASEADTENEEIKSKRSVRAMPELQ